MSDAPMPIVTFNPPALTQVCTAVEPDAAHRNPFASGRGRVARPRPTGVAA